MTAVASGKFTSKRVSLLKVVVTMKNINSRNTTSINGVMLIVSSSRILRLNFTEILSRSRLQSQPYLFHLHLPVAM